MRNWLVGQYNDIKGNLKWALVAALWWIVVQYGRRMLQLIPNIPGWLVTLILFCVSLAVFVWLAKSPRAFTTPQQQQPQSSGIPTLSSIQVSGVEMKLDATVKATAEWFRHAYYSPLTAEVEKNMRIVAEHNQPKDPAGFMAKFIGVGVVAYGHDMSWAYIFRSQALMLVEMNSVERGGWLPLAEATTRYELAVKEHPYDYRGSSFDSWLGYMKREQLLIHHPSDMLEITNRGKDFLRYLAHRGLNPNNRVG